MIREGHTIAREDRVDIMKHSTAVRTATPRASGYRNQPGYTAVVGSLSALPPAHEYQSIADDEHGHEEDARQVLVVEDEDRDRGQDHGQEHGGGGDEPRFVAHEPCPLGRHAAPPAYGAAGPSSSAMRSSLLYLARRSERATAPTLICPAPLPTARSASHSSSVSPD